MRVTATSSKGARMAFFSDWWRSVSRQRGTPAENATLPHFPATITLEVTSACNLKCVFCALTQNISSTSSWPIHLSETFWKKLKSEITRYKPRVILTGFGEPTLHPRFYSLLLDLESAKVQFSFSTNGIAIRASLLELIKNLGNLCHVNVSIDSPDPDLYRKLRGADINKVL